MFQAGCLEHHSTAAPDRQSIWGGVAWDDGMSSWEQTPPKGATQCAGAIVVSWSRQLGQQYSAIFA